MILNEQLILNKQYYQELLKKYENIKYLGENKFDNVVELTIRMILQHYRENKPIHVNFQGAEDELLEVGKQLFIEFANDIFLNHCDMPELKVGDRLRDTKIYMDGKRHYYLVEKIMGEKYQLKHTKRNLTKVMNYDALAETMVPVKQPSRQILNHMDFFKELNAGKEFPFPPTSFEQKTVFISRKTLWDALPNRNRIPAIYLPTPNEGNIVSPIRSIPALDDCVAYFAPNYDIVYQHILLKGEKVKTMVVFDTEADKIEQILQDKQRFGFNLIALTDSFNPIKKESIPCWNWFKEEIKIINAL